MRAIAIQGLVRRLITLEAEELQAEDSVIVAAERVSDKLRAHLSQRIGQEGYRTLLARALTLATVQFPQLGAVRVGVDSSLVGLHGDAGMDSQATGLNGTPQDSVAGAVALLAHLIGLLFVFIGQDLTLRVLSTVSPRLALGDAAEWENERL